MSGPWRVLHPGAQWLMPLSIHKINFSWVQRGSSVGQKTQGEGQSEEETGSVQIGRQRWDRGCLCAWFRTGINHWSTHGSRNMTHSGSMIQQENERRSHFKLERPSFTLPSRGGAVLIRRFDQCSFCARPWNIMTHHRSSILIVGWLKHRSEQYQRSLCWPPARLKCSTYILK